MPETIETRCCIAGGGPAGMMLGFLLARAGVDVCVLEKHADFLRDFRGDTIHPSTLEIMYELGLLEQFLKRPHQEIRQLSGQIGRDTIPIADFTHLPTHCKFLALMPQWDFLNFIAEQGRAFPEFHLHMEAEVTDLIEEKGRVSGVRVKRREGSLEVRAHLTIGADGRHSVVRKRAGLQVVTSGSAIDVLWMRLSRKTSDPEQTFGHADTGGMLVLIDRETYWQCAFVIPKGAADEIRKKGIQAFRQDIVRLNSFLSDRVEELRDWNDVSLLTVVVDRLVKWWRPGLLCIGDAAHAMSPIGGVGINLAIQDAVATANITASRLHETGVRDSDLDAVQRRRALPTRVIQAIQLTIQDRVIKRVLNSKKPLSPPWMMKALKFFPYLRRIPARVIGVGIRPEHVRTPPRPTKTRRAA